MEKIYDNWRSMAKCLVIAGSYFLEDPLNLPVVLAQWARNRGHIPGNPRLVRRQGRYQTFPGRMDSNSAKSIIFPARVLQPEPVARLERKRRLLYAYA